MHRPSPHMIRQGNVLRMIGARPAGRHQPTPIEPDASNEHDGAERREHPSIAEMVASDVPRLAP